MPFRSLLLRTRSVFLLTFTYLFVAGAEKMTPGGPRWMSLVVHDVGVNLIQEELNMYAYYTQQNYLNTGKKGSFVAHDTELPLVN